MTLIIVALAAVAGIVFIASKYWKSKSQAPQNLPKGGTPVQEEVEEKPAKTPKKRETSVEQ